MKKLKTWPEYFKRIEEGQKFFEIRKNDRDFQVGDELILQEYRPDTKEITGATIEAKINYILHGGQFGIEPGYCVMNLTGLLMDRN
jgi:hypothetical protein